LTTVLGNHTNLIDAAEQEYSIGSTADGWPITDDYDQISAIFTDAVYQCPMSMVANDSLSAGIPTWRYLYNATFPDIQPLPGLGVFHGSEGMPSIFTLLRLCSRFFFGPSYSCPPTDPLR
jgi:carboxylesterase type B